MNMPATERFWSKVDKTDGCWEWTASLVSGYGQFRHNGRIVRAHRFAYEQLVGPVPKGLELDHLCRNRRCVNPAHLEPVTQQENQLRGFGVSGINARKTHCLRGHEYTPENTVRWRRWRNCKTCQDLRRAAPRALTDGTEATNG